MRASSKMEIALKHELLVQNASSLVPEFDTVSRIIKTGILKVDTIYGPDMRMTGASVSFTQTR